MGSQPRGNRELFEEYSKTKDIELRNKLVEEYLYLVDILIKKYMNKGVDYDDLYQVGSMALVLAVERFDVSKGYEFTSYATPTIIGEIKRHFRDKSWAMKVPRRLKELSAKLIVAREELYGQLLRKPTISEISAYLGNSEEEILEAMESGQAYCTFSLNQVFESSNEDYESSVLEKYTGIEEEGYMSSEYGELIDRVFDKLSEKEKELFLERFIEEKTQQDIADNMNVSQMTISRLEKALRDKFKEEKTKE